MGRMCILGEMKARPLLLLWISTWISTQILACAEPERRPPTTYVPLVRGPEAAPLPPGPLEPASAPLGQDPTATPTAVTTKAATNDKTEKPTPGNDPANDEKCFRRVEGNCCAEPGKAKKKGGQCPAGMILGAKCKGIGRSCHP